MKKCSQTVKAQVVKLTKLGSTKIKVHRNSPKNNYSFLLYFGMLSTATYSHCTTRPSLCNIVSD